MRLDTLLRPPSKESVRDPNAYAPEHAPLTQASLFFKVGPADAPFGARRERLFYVHLKPT
jgi:hypothetical protein